MNVKVYKFENRIDKDAQAVPYDVAMNLLIKHNQYDIIEEVERAIDSCEANKDKINITIGRENWPYNDYVDIIFWINGLSVDGHKIKSELRYQWWFDENNKLMDTAKSYRIEEGERFQDFECFVETLYNY